MSNTKKELWENIYYNGSAEDFNRIFDTLAQEIGLPDAEDFCIACEDMEDEYSQSVAGECDYCERELTYIDLSKDECPTEGCPSNMGWKDFHRKFNGSY